ncbi:MAG: galactose mutarotase [Acidobacteriaceae bacterium]|nr:galactose mutarotase [Acidobacteriaceae bacterium]
MTQLTKEVFGKTPSGEELYLYTFRNSNGIETSITNYGGRVVTLKAPDRNGTAADLVLGFDNLDGYLEKNPYFGAIVGRFANRISNAEFTLDGQTYKLPRNSGNNSLHGGLIGFDKVVWNPRELERPGGPVLELTYLSRDGEEGYPGNLATTVIYSLTNDNELRIEYSATTDKKTILNLTNHSYFDLAGRGGDEVLDHVVTINADQFTPVNQDHVPTGELRSVAGTPFDFRTPTRIGDRIDWKEEQLKLGIGYDHNFVLNHDGPGVSFAARAVHPNSGRVLQVFTDQPGMQFYTGNHLSGIANGKGGVTYGFRSAFCFETQHFPDTPHHPEFPTTELSPGEQFRSTTIYKVSVEA